MLAIPHRLAFVYDWTLDDNRLADGQIKKF